MRWEIYFFVGKSLANGKGSINIFCFVILLSKKCEHSLEWVGYGRMALWNFDETTRFAWMWCHLIQFNLHEIFETRKSKHLNSLAFEQSAVRCSCLWFCVIRHVEQHRYLQFKDFSYYSHTYSNSFQSYFTTIQMVFHRLFFCFVSRFLFILIWILTLFFFWQMKISEIARQFEFCACFSFLKIVFISSSTFSSFPRKRLYHDGNNRATK